MVIRYIIRNLIFILFIFHNSSAEIIYSKKNIIITSSDIKNYININYENQNEYLSNEVALKKLILNKSLILSLEKKNPKVFNYIKNKLTSIIDEKELSTIEYDYFFFQILKNEFLSQYFVESFNQEDFFKLINNSDQINITISKNSCLTIHKVIDLREKEIIIKNLYNNLKSNNYQNQFEIENNFSVCMNDKIYKYIEMLILEYIEKRTKNEFTNFIYNGLK